MYAHYGHVGAIPYIESLQALIQISKRQPYGQHYGNANVHVATWVT